MNQVDNNWDSMYNRGNMDSTPRIGNTGIVNEGTQPSAEQVMAAQSSRVYCMGTGHMDLGHKDKL